MFLDSWHQDIRWSLDYCWRVLAVEREYRMLELGVSGDFTFGRVMERGEDYQSNNLAAKFMLRCLALIWLLLTYIYSKQLACHYHLLRFPLPLRISSQSLPTVHKAKFFQAATEVLISSTHRRTNLQNMPLIVFFVNWYPANLAKNCTVGFPPSMIAEQHWSFPLLTARHCGEGVVVISGGVPKPVRSLIRSSCGCGDALDGEWKRARSVTRRVVVCIVGSCL